MAPNIRSKKSDPSLIREYLDYLPNGRMFWVKGHLAGREAGFDMNNGRAGIRFQGVNITRSYIVWAWHHGKWPNDNAQLDHINRDSFDDRIENLREVSSSANCRNRGNSVDLLHISYAVSKNPIIHFKQAIPSEIFEEKAQELRDFLKAWLQSIEDHILGNLPSGTDPVEDALEVIQCTEPYHDIIGNLQLQHERMP